MLPILVAILIFFLSFDSIKSTLGSESSATPKKWFFSTLESVDVVMDDGGTVHPPNEANFVEGGCGSGFVSRKNGEVITFPIDDFTNMKAGTVELCVTPKQKLVDGKDYYLFMVGDGRHAVILQIAWNGQDEDPKKHFHDVRLRVKPGNIVGRGARVRTSKIDWQPEEHHHIAATWGEAGMYIYIDGELDIAALYQKRSKDNVASGRENLDTPFVINNNHYDPHDAVVPTNCVVSDLGIHNFQKSHAEVKKRYDALYPNE